MYPTDQKEELEMISFVDGKYVVDGSMMEGGGQVLRLAACLSIICNTCSRVIKIRGNRRPPGLCHQHLKGLELINALTSGRVQGLRVGSNEVEITPGKINGGNHRVDCQTAGSVTLIMQGIFPCALFAEKKISEFEIRGGTHVNWSPFVDYVEEVFLPVVEFFGIQSKVAIKKRGFYPDGGGEITFKTKAVKALKAIELTDKGHVTSIWGEVVSTLNVHISVVNNIRNGALEVLQENFPNVFVDIIKTMHPSPKSSATGICLFAETSTGCRFGVCELKQQSEEPWKFGQASASLLVQDIRSQYCVDKHLQDQLIVFMALAEGTSRIRTGPITSHTATAIEIASNLTKAQFRVTPDGECNILECIGIGFQNEFWA